MKLFLVQTVDKGVYDFDVGARPAGSISLITEKKVEIGCMLL